MEQLREYLKYRINWQIINKMPVWYENAKKYPNGLDWTEPHSYYPSFDIMSKSLEQGGMSHKVLSFDEWLHCNNLLKKEIQ